MDSSRLEMDRSQKPRVRRASSVAQFLRDRVHYSETAFVDIKIEDGSFVVAKREETFENDKTGADHVPGVQEPGSVRVYLCPNQDCIEQLEDYLEFGDQTKDLANDKDRYGFLGTVGGLPYDLGDMASWLQTTELKASKSVEKESIPQRQGMVRTSSKWKPRLLTEADASFTFTELLSKDNKGKPEYAKSIQHTIYLFNDAEEKSTIVWNCYNSKYTTDVSPYQKTFLDSLLNGKAFTTTHHGIETKLANFSTLFLLEILTTDITIFSHAVQNEIDPKPITDLTDTRNAILTSPFAAMETRIYSFNRIKALLEKAEDLSSTIHHLAIFLPLTQTSPHLRALTLKTDNLVKHTRRIDARSTDLFALNTTVSQSRQSFYVTILTVLAAVFLPLSLASAVLSMQYRFSELGTRLYDFFGVAWLFFTFAILCGAAVRVGNHVNDKLWRLRHLDRSGYGTYQGVVKGIAGSYGVAWVFVLVGFLLGMFLAKDGVDWRAYPFLGVGVAIFVLAPVVVPVLDVIFLVFSVFVSWGSFWRGCTFSRKKDKTEGIV